MAADLFALAICMLLVGFAGSTLYLHGLVRRYQHALKRARRIRRRSQQPPTIVLAEVHIVGQAVHTDITVSSDLLEVLANGIGQTLVPVMTRKAH